MVGSMLLTKINQNQLFNQLITNFYLVPIDRRPCPWNTGAGRVEAASLDPGLPFARALANPLIPEIARDWISFNG